MRCSFRRGRLARAPSASGRSQWSSHAIPRESGFVQGRRRLRTPAKCLDSSRTSFPVDTCKLEIAANRVSCSQVELGFQIVHFIALATASVAFPAPVASLGLED